MNALPIPRMMALLWRQAVLSRRSQGSIWLTWVLLAIAALLCLAPILARQLVLVLLVMAPLFAVGLIWSVAFFGFCRQQYWQLGAGLVPGLRDGIRRIVIVLSLCLAALVGGAGGLVVGYPALFVGSVLYLMSGAMVRTPWIMLVLSMLQFVVPPDVARLLLTPPGQALFLLVALVLWWREIEISYPASSAAIADKHAQMRAFPNALRPGDPTAPARSPASSLASRLYGRALANDVRLKRRLAIHVLGASAHWSSSLGVLVFPGITVACMVKFAGFRLEGASFMLIQVGLVASMWLLGLAKIQLMKQQLAATVDEQGILRLAPGIPAGSQLTHEVVGGMWQRWMVWWIASVIGTMVALAPGFESPEMALRMLAWLSASLVTSAYLLSDYATGFKPQVLGSRAFLGLLFVALLLLAAFLIVRTYVEPLSWAVMVLVNAGAAAALLHARWRKLAWAPSIFPVGRFS